jgi:hypothetical protein
MNIYYTTRYYKQKREDKYPEINSQRTGCKNFFSDTKNLKHGEPIVFHSMEK